MPKRGNGNGKYRGGPESTYYDTIKRQQVCVTLADFQTIIEGRLKWVDRFTIGVETVDGEEMIYKSSIAKIKKS